jgi:hypothetical protein
MRVNDIQWSVVFKIQHKMQVLEHSTVENTYKQVPINSGFIHFASTPLSITNGLVTDMQGVPKRAFLFVTSNEQQSIDQ